MGERFSHAAARKAVTSSPLATRELSDTPNCHRFPKSARILRSSDFRHVYKNGIRVSGPCFAAFCVRMDRAAGEGPRIGFTVTRAVGGAVVRNRIKRRMREILRKRLADIGPQWDIVINPRRPALSAVHEELRSQLERIIQRCKPS